MQRIPPEAEKFETLEKAKLPHRRKPKPNKQQRKQNAALWQQVEAIVLGESEAEDLLNDLAESSGSMLEGLFQALKTVQLSQPS